MMATQTSGASTWLTINNKLLSFQPDDENQALNIQEYSTYTIKITQKAPDDLELAIDGQPLETERNGRWRWRPAHYAGLYRITITSPDHQPQNALVRVFPHKFTQSRYEKMKHDLSKVAIDLHFRLASPAIERAAYALPEQDSSALQEYKKIRKIIEQMKDIMSHIQREPYQGLKTEQVQRNWQRVTTFSSEIVPLPGDYEQLPTSVVSRYGISSLPIDWLQPVTIATYDTYENRLLQHFLKQQLVPKLTLIQQHAQTEKEHLEPIAARYNDADKKETLAKLKHVINECQDMKERCLRWSNASFLHTLPPPTMSGKATQVLLKHPTYSRFYQLYLQFQQSLKTTIDTEKYINELALRKVSELYELWCVFEITKMIIEELLNAGYSITSSSLFYEIEKDHFQFDVKKNVASIIMEKGDVRVEFKYEPFYPNQSTVHFVSALVATIPGTNPQTPDMAVEIYKGDTPQNVLIFDAKYRWEPGEEGRFYPKQENIDAMHRYYNVIRYKRYLPQTRQSQKTEQIVSCAYILYPGNQLYNGPDNKVGALPFIPGSSSYSNDVRQQLQDLLYNAYLID